MSNVLSFFGCMLIMCVCLVGRKDLVVFKEVILFAPSRFARFHLWGYVSLATPKELDRFGACCHCPNEKSMILVTSLRLFPRQRT